MPYQDLAELSAGLGLMLQQILIPARGDVGMGAKSPFQIVQPTVRQYGDDALTVIFRALCHLTRRKKHRPGRFTNQNTVA